VVGLYHAGVSDPGRPAPPAARDPYQEEIPGHRHFL